jgi:hypothetical protein
VKSKSTSRRSFTKSGVADATTSATAGPSLGAQGANDRIRVACIGLNKKGRSHIRNYLALKSQGVELVALCDVDDHVLQKRASEVETESGSRPATYRDIRELLDNNSIDAV